MREIQQITNYSNQKHAIALDDGTLVSFSLYYRPNQQGWFFTSITYGDFILSELRVCNNPNMLYQWKNILPFGIACASASDREPTLQDDFSSGASKLYLLSTEEIESYAEFLNG